MAVNINDITLKIGGKTLDALSNSLGIDSFSKYILMNCSLEVSLLKPAELRLTMRREKNERKNFDINLKQFREAVLGKKVECSVTTVYGKDEAESKLTFNGVAVEVDSGKLNTTVIAYSDDYLLNDAPCCESFTDKSIAAVLTEIVGQVDTTLDLSENFGKPISYTVRYNETSYQFIARLALQYGLWMFWDLKNNKLVVSDVLNKSGNKNMTPIKDYSGFTYKLKTMYPRLPYATYNYLENKINKSTDKEDVTTNVMVDSVNKCSKNAFIGSDTDANYKPKKFYDYSVASHQEKDAEWLKGIVKSHTSSIQSQYVECTGQTNVADLEIGSVITLQENGKSILGAATISEHQKLVVIGVKYEWNTAGDFTGNFTAIPKDMKKPPYFDPGAYPKSGVQRAVVVDNKDDKGWGRVKVQFLWQATMDEVDVDSNKPKNTISPWIRVVQPYAGKGVGCYIIPEIGDEVLIGFEHDNVEKPYVIGVLYHGGAEEKDYVAPDKKWTKPDNSDAEDVNIVKAFRTRSGQTVEIHDNKKNAPDKEGFVRIYTKPVAQNNGGANNNNGNNNGNAAPREYDIVLSKDDWRKANDIDKALKAADAEKVKIGVASDGSIVISCAENLVLKAKNVKIIADETFDMSVAGKTGGKWNDDKDWKDTEFGTKMAIAKDKMEISAVGKDTKMTVRPIEENKAAQKFDLTIGHSFIIVDGTKNNEKIFIDASKSHIIVDGKKDSEKIDVKAKESFVTVDGKNNAEKIDLQANNNSSIIVDGKNGAEAVKITAKDSSVFVSGKKDTERVSIKSKDTGIYVNGHKDALLIESGESSVSVDDKNKKVTVNTDGSVTLKGEKGLTIDGGTDLKINATKAAVETKAVLNIKGKTVTVDGGPLLQLKGNSIKNN